MISSDSSSSEQNNQDEELMADNQDNSSEDPVSSSPESEDSNEDVGSFTFNGSDQDLEDEEEYTSSFADSDEESEDEIDEVNMDEFMYPFTAQEGNKRKIDGSGVEVSTKRSCNDSDDDMDEELPSKTIQLREDRTPHPTQEELSRMVLDFFISQGIKEPIMSLCEEMNIEIPHEEIKLLDARTSINSTIKEGNIESAIKQVNEICPQLMENNPEICFRLRKQLCVEMIRQGQTEQPLHYARSNIINDTDISEDHIEQIEKVFTLMAFEVTDDTPFHYQYAQSERDKLATDVNGAILSAFNRSPHSRISTLYRLVAWAKRKMDRSDLDRGRGTYYSPDSLFEETTILRDLIKVGQGVDPIDFTADIC